MIFKLTFLALFTILSGARILPKSDVDKRPNQPANNLTSKRLNPIQRRYLALSDILRRRTTVANQRSPPRPSTRQHNTGTVFDTIGSVEGSADADYDYPLRDRKASYAYHVRSNGAGRTNNIGYGIIFTARG